jgi:hypothetical protein
VPELGVGGVGDGVDLEPRDVRVEGFDGGHRRRVERVLAG